MTAPALEHALDGLRGGLEGLISCFESERSPESAALDAAWLHVQQGFERVRSEIDALGAARQPFQERVDDCLRLYAVAAGVLARRREELAGARAACTVARAKLRDARAGESSGGSCDVRG